MPSDVARDLGPLVEEDRLLVWTRDPAEQALLDEIGMLGALPPLGDDGGFSVVVTNRGRSKIDAFLDRTVDTNVVTADDGTRTLVADVTLDQQLARRRAATLRDRQLVRTAERVELPVGELLRPGGHAHRDAQGEVIETDAPEPEAGWWATSFDDILGPGETVTYRVEYPLGPALDDVEAPVRWDQPLARRAAP